MLRFLYRDLRHQITIFKTPILHFNVFNGVVIVQNHQNPFLKSISNISKSTTKHSLAVDYLVNSCGLPPEKALSAAKRFNFCSIAKADSVISLFQSYGLIKTHITKIISMQPTLLSVDPNKILKPKFEFLSNLGISGTDLSKLFARSPALLSWSLEKVLVPNISTLQVHCVPDYNIAKMLFSNPRSLCQSDRFKETVQKIKKLGFDPLSPTFCKAVCAMSSISKSSWDKKLIVYGEFGLSENDVIFAFKRRPEFMKISEKKIRRDMEFFLKKLKCKPTYMSCHPALLLLSLDKRIIPRCAVLKILYSKGILKNKLSLVTVFIMAEMDFSEKLVIKYQEIVPEVMNAYKGGIEFDGFGEVVEVKDLYLEPVKGHIPPVVTAV